MGIADRYGLRQKPATTVAAPKVAARQKIIKQKAIAEAKEGRGPGRPKSGREQITLMLSSDVLARYRATGDGWRQLIDETLRKALEKS